MKLWSSRQTRIVALVCLMLVASMPVMAQEASPDVEADAASLIPTVVGGRTLEFTTFSGQDIFANIDAGDPDQVEDFAAFETMIGSIGTSIEQVSVTSASGFDEEGGILVLAIQIMDLDAATFIEPWLQVFARAEFYDEPQFENGQLGGKDVILVSEADSPFAQISYGYASGDTVWVILGDDESVVEVLEALP